MAELRAHGRSGLRLRAQVVERGVDAVVDDLELARVEAQPARQIRKLAEAHGEVAVSQATEDALGRAIALAEASDVAGVVPPRDRHGHAREARRQASEQIGLESLGHHDVRPALPHQARQTHQRAQGASPPRPGRERDERNPVRPSSSANGPVACRQHAAARNCGFGNAASSVAAWRSAPPTLRSRVTKSRRICGPVELVKAASPARRSRGGDPRCRCRRSSTRP